MPVDDSSCCPEPDCTALISARIGSAETEEIVLICERGHMTTMRTDDLEQ